MWLFRLHSSTSNGDQETVFIGESLTHSPVTVILNESLNDLLNLFCSETLNHSGSKHGPVEKKQHMLVMYVLKHDCWF